MRREVYHEAKNILGMKASGNVRMLRPKKTLDGCDDNEDDVNIIEMGDV